MELFFSMWKCIRHVKIRSTTIKYFKLLALPVIEHVWARISDKWRSAYEQSYIYVYRVVQRQVPILGPKIDAWPMDRSPNPAQTICAPWYDGFCRLHSRTSHVKVSEISKLLKTTWRIGRKTLKDSNVHVNNEELGSFTWRISDWKAQPWVYRFCTMV